MKNTNKPLLSVASKPIPCKTYLRGNFQFSQLGKTQQLSLIILQ